MKVANLKGHACENPRIRFSNISLMHSGKEAVKLFGALHVQEPSGEQNYPLQSYPMESFTAL